MRILPLLALLAACPSPEDETDATDEAVDTGSSTDTAVSESCASQGLVDAPWGCAYDCTEDVGELGSGVGTVDVTGALPASLILTGERSCIVMLDPDDQVLVASSRVGAGRVWVAAHDAYATSPVGQAGLRWVSEGQGTVQAPSGYHAMITDAGLTPAAVDLAALDGVKAVMLDAGTELDAEQISALGAFLDDGGGLFTAGQAWWWATTHDTPAALDYPANAWLWQAGVAITSEPAWGAGVDTPLTSPAPDWLHHRTALLGMRAVWDGDLDWDLETQRLAVNTSLDAMAALPLARTDYYDVAIPYSDAVGPVTPTADDPLDATTQLPEVLAARVQGKLFAERPADLVGVYGAVADFPGEVTSAVRETRTVTVDASYAGRDGDYIYSGAGASVWRATGVYAAPGEVLSVTVPASLVDVGASVLIGSWTDTLWGKDSWERFPEITRSQPVDATNLTIGSAFGGPVYVRIPAGLDLGDLDVEVTNGVPMAHYVHGATTWSEVVDHPAPWAEIGSDRFIMTVPRADLGLVSDASALMDFWDGVMDGMSALEGQTAPRTRAERMVVDRQISAGWMHSGYPFMAHLVSAEEVLSLTSLQASGAWGPFHELGHNHQYRPWVLPGTTETSCNLWSVYTSEQSLGLDRGSAHSALAPADREARIAAYIAGGRDFSQWSVWTALETYLQLQEAFGWQLYSDVFADYRAMPENARPTTDQARIDLWAEMTSARAGVDLGPFYTAWGFPLSQATLDSMATRPTWTADPMNP
ncbi:MAG: hypothetical protein EP330_09665 [Deltaproteobacteria bacterium]|nr:MAG: hypothetical protein EP330_09665 [Deltaproteobacteria bacterium]